MIKNLNKYLPCLVGLLNGTFSSLKTASAKVFSSQQTSPWTCKGMGTDSNSEGSSTVVILLSLMPVFKNTCWSLTQIQNCVKFLLNQSTGDSTSKMCKNGKRIEESQMSWRNHNKDSCFLAAGAIICFRVTRVSHARTYVVKVPTAAHFLVGSWQISWR